MTECIDIKDFDIILDVRTYEEYCKEHLHRSLLINTPKPPFTKETIKSLSNNLKNIMEGVGKNTMILVYCDKGIRSHLASIILVSIGYENVINLGSIKNLHKSCNKNFFCYCKVK